MIYLAVAYFKIYTDDEEAEPLEKNAEAIDVEGKLVKIDILAPLVTRDILSDIDKNNNQLQFCKISF